MYLFAHGESVAFSGPFPPWEWHPAVVHFPIAFLLGAVVLDLYAWGRGRADLARAASWLMAAGAAIGAVAVATGAVAFFTVPAHTEAAHRLMYWHLGLMGAAVVGFAAVLDARARAGRPGTAARIAGLVAAGVLIIGAYLGGTIVYRGGAGIDPKILSPEVLESHHHGSEPHPSESEEHHHHD